MTAKRALWLSALCLSTFGVAIVALSSATGQEPGGVKWRTDYNVARKEAQEKGLLLIIDFRKDACVFCDMLASQTFTNPEVIKALNEKFIPLKMRLETDGDLCKHLGIDAFPTVLMASPTAGSSTPSSAFRTREFTDGMQRASPRCPSRLDAQDLAQTKSGQ